MAAAAIATIGRAKTRHQNDARAVLVQFAFVPGGAQDAGDLGFHCVEQVIDMPAQCLVASQVSRDACFVIAFCRAGVDILASRKIEFAQAADLQAQGLTQVDAELVGAEHGVFVWLGGGIVVSHWASL